MAKSSLFPALETPHHSIPYSSAPVPINPQTSSNISEEMHNPKTKRKMYFSVFPFQSSQMMYFSGLMYVYLFVFRKHLASY
jgi:hypothetical protein